MFAHAFPPEMKKFIPMEILLRSHIFRKPKWNLCQHEFSFRFTHVNRQQNGNVFLSLGDALELSIREMKNNVGLKSSK